MRSDEDTLKNVELLASVATALAKYDLPVPGGCKSNTMNQATKQTMDNLYQKRYFTV